MDSLYQANSWNCGSVTKSLFLFIHSAQGAGGKLQLNMHTPLIQWSQGRLTMLSRHSVGTHQGNVLAYNAGNACQSSQLAVPLRTGSDPWHGRAEWAHASWLPLAKKKKWAGNDEPNFPPQTSREKNATHTYTHLLDWRYCGLNWYWKVHSLGETDRFTVSNQSGQLWFLIFHMQHGWPHTCNTLTSHRHTWKHTHSRHATFNLLHEDRTIIFVTIVTRTTMSRCAWYDFRWKGSYHSLMPPYCHCLPHPQKHGSMP